ncbi:MAG: CHASE domain-containing protein [Thauera sp.]|nr:CHASE domain-containing protein [Thauera sp.]
MLCFSVTLTVLLWHYARTDRTGHVHQRFDYRVSKEKSILLSRLDAYQQVVRGAQALFAASEEVSREEWHTYVAQLKLEKHLPGIQGIGYGIVVPAEAKAAHERAMRAAGFPDYAIQPEAERDLYTSIIYLEPFTGRNLRAFGYDMLSEPVRREAMERARDTGEAAMSGKVTLVQESTEDVQPGFLIYLPVYRRDMPHATVAERRAALVGYVYSPFRAHDLMKVIFGSENEDIEVDLFDQTVAPQNLMFASGRPAGDALFEQDVALEFAGRRWIARFKSTAAFDAITRNDEPLLILIGGLSLDLMLFAVMLGSARHQRRMQAAAMQIQHSHDRYHALVENMPGAVFRTEATPPWRAVHLSKGVESLTGARPERFLSGEISCRSLVHADDRKLVDEALTDALAGHAPYNVEYRLRGADGQIRWVSERGCGSYDSAGQAQWVDGVILDITDRKLAELAIREMAFYDPLTTLPNRRLLLDRLHHQLSSSARSGLHGALLFIDLDEFKRINDTLGHHTGDLLLAEVAQRLRAGVREADTVARLGGDEFIVMLDDLGPTAEEAMTRATAIGMKLLASLQAAYLLETHVVTCTPSVGLTTFSGRGLSADELIRRADEAMYRAKAAGRNRLNVF